MKALFSRFDLAILEIRTVEHPEQPNYHMWFKWKKKTKKTEESKEKEWNEPIERAWIELERSTWLISWFFGTRTEYSMTITMCNGRYTPWYPYVCAPPSHKVIHVIKIILTRLCPRLLPRTYSPFQRVYIILLIFPMISNRSWWLCKLAAPKNKTNKS